MFKTYVPSSGDPKSCKYIIVGEQPGRMEVIRQKPFIGPAGQQLDQILQDAKIKRSDCYLTNIFKDIDHPLNFYMAFNKNKPPTISKEGQEQIDNLIKEINACSASIIIATGNVPLYALTQRYGITKWRGSILYPIDTPGKILIPTLHPATIIPPKFQYKNKHLIYFDMRRAKEINKGDFKQIAKNCIISPTYTQCMDFLTSCLNKGRNKEVRWIAYDIEVTNLEVSCISFSYQENESICIPFIGSSGDYFTTRQELNIWLKIAEILEDENIPKLGQNLTFDAHFLLRKYGIHIANIHDTMIMQRLLMSEYKIGLDFIASIWTDIAYYKDEGKFWLKGLGSFERGWEYNCLDSLVCIQAASKQYKEIEERELTETYNRTRKVILPLIYMMERGTKINLSEMQKAYDESGVKIHETKLKLNEMCKKELNANSPKQLADYFYKERGIKAYVNKKGGDSTDEEAMKRIARRGFPEAEVVLEIRRMVKERSTYLDTSKVDKDGRMRCSYNPAGTRYSRLSSSESIFGTGNNLQNQPHSVLKYFISDDGYVAYEIDLSQAENRIVAYVGRVTAMINAFETKQDVHSLTGALISGKTPEEVLYEDKNDIKCPIAGGQKTWRYWGKKANHGFNYDLGPDNFALHYEIDVGSGRLIYRNYHKAYPEIQNHYHGYVKTCLLKDRTLTNLMGRKTYFMDNLSDFRGRDQTFKAAYSCIPQGTVGDVINERGLNYIYYSKSLEKVELLMQVHDSIKFQIPINIGWLNHAILLTDIKTNLEQPLTTHYGRSFVIPADIQIGKNFGDMGKIKADEVSSNLNEFATLLEERYNEAKN